MGVLAYSVHVRRGRAGDAGRRRVLLLCRGSARADSPVTDRMVRWWAAVWLRAAGARVAVHDLEHVRPAAAYVVVSNHQSNLDLMVHLQALPLSLRVLAKREMFQILLLGPAMRTAGMIEVDRDSPDFRRIDQAAARSLAEVLGQPVAAGGVAGGAGPGLVAEQRAQHAAARLARVVERILEPAVLVRLPRPGQGSQRFPARTPARSDNLYFPNGPGATDLCRCSPGTAGLAVSDR